LLVAAPLVAAVLLFIAQSSGTWRKPSFWRWYYVAAIAVNMVYMLIACRAIRFRRVKYGSNNQSGFGFSLALMQ
jgi:anti-sigma-K factor RskA